MEVTEYSLPESRTSIKLPEREIVKGESTTKSKDSPKCSVKFREKTFTPLSNLGIQTH
jgi:hypothetical protein